jgi:hypothetical protein
MSSSCGDDDQNECEKTAEQVNAAPGRSVKVQWDIQVPDREEIGLGRRMNSGSGNKIGTIIL